MTPPCPYMQPQRRFPRNTCLVNLIFDGKKILVKFKPKFRPMNRKNKGASRGACAFDYFIERIISLLP